MSGFTRARQGNAPTDTTAPGGSQHDAQSFGSNSATTAFMLEEQERERRRRSADPAGLAERAAAMRDGRLPGPAPSPGGLDSRDALSGLGVLGEFAANVPFLQWTGIDAIGGVFEGLDGLAGARDEDADPASTMNAVTDVVSSAAGHPTLDPLLEGVPVTGDQVGMVGNALSIYTGTRDAFGENEEQDREDHRNAHFRESRYLGGADAAANGFAMAGTMGGADLTALLGTKASTLLAAETSGAAFATGTGAVISAGVAGYKVGQLGRSIATSDNGANAHWGQDDGGRDRHAMDWVMDTCMDANAWMDQQGAAAGDYLGGRGASLDRWLDETTGTEWMGNLANRGLTAAGGAVEDTADWGGGLLSNAVLNPLLSAVALPLGVFDAGYNYVTGEQNSLY